MDETTSAREHGRTHQGDGTQTKTNDILNSFSVIVNPSEHRVASFQTGTLAARTRHALNRVLEMRCIAQPNTYTEGTQILERDGEPTENAFAALVNGLGPRIGCLGLDDDCNSFELQASRGATCPSPERQRCDMFTHAAALQSSQTVDPGPPPKQAAQLAASALTTACLLSQACLIGVRRCLVLSR